MAYSMQGHGCDLGETLIVPKGCVYVTLAVCGYSIDPITRNRISFIELFNKHHPYHYLLKDPVRHEKDIRDLGIFIHVHYDGHGCDPTYTDVIYNSFVGYDTNETLPPGKYVQPSGLHELGADLSSSDCPFPTVTIPPVKFIKCDTLTEDILAYVYKDSIFPTAEKVKMYIADKTPTFELFQSIGMIKQSQLFELYPGIHYNMSCRSACEETIPSTLALRRRHSYQKDSTLLIPGYKPATLHQLRLAIELYLIREDVLLAPIGSWDVSKITTMKGLFKHSTFNEDISDWDVSNVVSMEHIFTSSQYSHSLAAWNPEKLVRFDAEHSRIPALFKLPVTLQYLSISDSPITSLDFDTLHPYFAIKFERTSLDARTIARLLKFYHTESRLDTDKKAFILRQFSSGDMKVKRKSKTRRIRPSVPLVNR